MYIEFFNTTKPFWKSKTLWVNLLIIASGVAAWASGQVDAGLPITLAGVLNTILRVMTKEGIDFGKYDIIAEEIEEEDE
jgi:hypothetical protein